MGIPGPFGTDRRPDFLNCVFWLLFVDPGTPLPPRGGGIPKVGFGRTPPQLKMKPGAVSIHWGVTFSAAGASLHPGQGGGSWFLGLSVWSLSPLPGTHPWDGLAIGPGS